MHTSYSVFKYFIYTIILLSAISISCNAKTEISISVQDGYSILPKNENSDIDKKWAEYMLFQSINRINDKSIIENKKTNKKDFLNIYVHISNSTLFDYSISTGNNEITLTASSEKNMLWLVYQCIAKISEFDSRWNAKDLDPAIISLSDTKKKFDFGYRSIYSSPMTDTDKIAISGDMHVDYDWGLWGHNLNKVFKNKEIPLEAMATVNGRKTDSQFCFSSETLMKAISEYIIDSYGNGNDGNKGWFSIIPNDNMEVCTCEKCKKVGNTNKSATPAVTSLIYKLAIEFPNHRFYTSAYNTTSDAPKNKLPENAGVIISAIDLPLNTGNFNSTEYLDWKKKLNKWQAVTDKIIVWDYMRNFDDYLTPYPCLFSIQHRLKWFKSLGIYGIFYNGSGDDYSTFDDMQTYIISSILKNIDIDVMALTEKYLENFYPKSNKVIYDYYSKLETEIKEKNITLEWYSGIDYAINSYLSPENFRSFYTELDLIAKKTKDEERKKLNMLLTALNYTQLEIIRSGHYKNEIKNKEKTNEYLELLKGYVHFKNMTKYREAFGNISEYIDSWEKNIYYNKNNENAISIKEKEYGQKLTDGYYGSPLDYHTHWVILKKDINEISINTKISNKEAKFELSFLNAPKWKISPPSKVEIFQNNIIKGTWKPEHKTTDDFSVTKATFTTSSLEPGKEIRILIYKGNKPQIACDEINIYNIKK